MGAYQDTDHYGGVDWIKEKHNAMGVIDDLIEKLTSDSPDERMSAALEISTKTEELSLTGDYAVKKLMYVANGGVRTFTLATWRTLWRNLPKDYYGLEHQLAAIEALGNIRGKKVEGYLARLLEYKIDTAIDDDTYSMADSSARAQLTDAYVTRSTVICHPHARGDLGINLTFRSGPYFPAEKDTGLEALKAMKESPVRKKLEEVYEKLKQNLGRGF